MSSTDSLGTKKIWSPSRSFIHGAILISILALAAALRINGLEWGLPYLYHPDESIFVKRAVPMVAELDLNPRWFGHPGTLTLYILVVPYIGYALLGLAAGWFSSLGDFAAAYAWDASAFHFIGRLSNLIVALANLLLLWFVARRVAPGWVALLAVAGLALIPMNIQFSTLIRPDMLHTFTMLLVAYFALGAARDDRIRDYIFGGIALGLAVSVKYTAAIAGVGILAAALLQNPMTDFRTALEHAATRLVTAGVATIATVFVVSPFLFIDFQTALGDLAREADFYSVNAMSDGVFSTLSFYVKTLSAEVTILGLILAGIGVIAMLRSGDRASWVLVLMALTYLLAHSFLPLRWARWVIPLLPFFAIFIAVGVYTISKAAEQIVKRPWPAVLAALIAVIWLQPLLSAALAVERNWKVEHARSVAASWVADNLPKGSNILQERYTPQLLNGDYNLFYVEKARRGGNILPLKQNRKYIVPINEIGHLRDFGDIESSGIDYVILGKDYSRRKRLPKAGRIREAAAIKIYEEIFDRFELLAKFKKSAALNDSEIYVFRVTGE